MELMKNDCYKKAQMDFNGITAKADGPFYLM